MLTVPVRRWLVTVVLVLATAAQLAFAVQFRSVQPFRDILPPVPPPRALEAAAFGDPQFLYRILVADLQDFGDTGGRQTRMSDYDMPGVVAWLNVLGSLDRQAHHHAFLAAHYFSQTQRTADVRYLVDYLTSYAGRDPRHWQWVLQATYLADARLKDAELAARVSEPLAYMHDAGIPWIVRQVPAVMLAKRGDPAAAAALMRSLVEEARTRASADDLASMQAYEEDLRRLADPD
jgi:hypothetical protein